MTLVLTRVVLPSPVDRAETSGSQTKSDLEVENLVASDMRKTMYRQQWYTACVLC